MNDIATFVAINDTSVKRGAFEGAELEAIGSLKNRTVAFLKGMEAAPTVEEEEAKEIRIRKMVACDVPAISARPATTALTTKVDLTFP